MLELSLDFLSKLKDNNNKPWFDANKTEFEKAKSEFATFINLVLIGIQSFDEKLADLQPKDGIYRIYRDVRFSTDKTPYKTHFGAFFATSGKKSNGPGYYIHIEPSGTFVGGGMYMPESPILQKIRQEIDYNGNKLLEILNKPSFKQFYPSLWEEGKLARPPKGYEPDNQYIELLKLKSFVCTYNVPKNLLLTNKIADDVIKAMKELYPLMEFLREATT